MVFPNGDLDLPIEEQRKRKKRKRLRQMQDDEFLEDEELIAPIR